nr:S8 family serine peptidase [uncultured Desulfobacter sp.]
MKIFFRNLTAMLLSLIWTGNVFAAGADRLKQHPEQLQEGTYVEGHLLVKMKPGVSAKSLKSSINILSSTSSKTASPSLTIKSFSALKGNKVEEVALINSPDLTTKEMLRELKSHPDVALAEPDYIITIDAVPDDTDFNQLWALENTGQVVDEEPGTPDADIDAPEAWDLVSASAQKVIVAVIDTGVDYTHKDLAANMWTNDQELYGTAGVDDDGNGWVDDIYGIDAVNKDGDPYDDHYHGTHVAGTIAAVTDNGAGISGVTWNQAKIMALKFLGSSGSGATSDAVTCINYLLEMNQRSENNIVVMNASWGSTAASETLKEALETASSAGIILSAAAGNDTNDCDGEQKHYPSSLDVPNVISVGATDQDDKLAYFSNYGASEVDIAAPGVNILSTIPGGGYSPVSGDLFFDSMEAGEDNWDLDLTTGAWGITEEEAFHENMAWSDSPYGDYVQGESGEHLDYNLVSKAMDLSEYAGTHLMLGFWLYKDLSTVVSSCGKKDGLYVEASGDDGETWTTLGSQTGSDPNWKSYSYTIPDGLLTSQFRIRFRLFVIPHGTADGVYLDKIGIGESNAMGAFKFAKGTSMAAPHVAGVLALAASLFPDETMEERISRLYSGGDSLDSLKSLTATDRRINLAGSLASSPSKVPLITEFEVIETDTLTIQGNFFGSDQGRIMFHDAYTPDTGVDAQITSWSDTRVTATKPAYSGGYFYLVDADGTRSARRPMEISHWVDGTASVTQRDSATTAMVDKKIYTFGGFVSGNSALRSWEVYSLDTDTWEYPYGSWMTSNRAHLTSAVLSGKIYLISGYTTAGEGHNIDTVTVFDPESRTFTDIESFPEAACFSRATTAQGRIYVTGGLDEDDMPMDTIYSFDPTREQANKWQAESVNLSQARFSHGTVTVNDKVYIFGGLETWEDGEVFTATGEIFDPQTGTLSEMAAMPAALGRFGTAADGRYIYVVGGTGNDFWYSPTKAVLRYDTQTDTWSSLADRQLCQARLSCGAVFVSGKGLYTINGGILDDGSFSSTSQGLLLAEAFLADADGDQIPDQDDNCRLTANRAQIDTDNDGYGNACDCDLNNDDVVSLADFSNFRQLWGGSSESADFNSDGRVNQIDYIIFKKRWGSQAPFE